MRLFECRVPAVYLTWANQVFSAFFSLNGINKLRGISWGQNSDSHPPCSRSASSRVLSHAKIRENLSAYSEPSQTASDAAKTLRPL